MCLLPGGLRVTQPRAQRPDPVLMDIRKPTSIAFRVLVMLRSYPVRPLRM